MIYFCKLHFFPSQEHSRAVPISNWFQSLSCKTWIFLNHLISQVAIFFIAGAQLRCSHQQPISLLVLQNTIFSQMFNFANCNFLHHRSTVVLFVPATSFIVKDMLIMLFTKRNFFLNDLFLQIVFFLLQKHSRVVPISNWFYSLSCKTWFFLNRLISQIAFFYISGAQSCHSY